jgi:hypothetical protein
MFRLIHLSATNMLVLQLSFILWPAPCGQPEIQEHEKNRLDAGPSQAVSSQGPQPGVGCPESEFRKYGHPRRVPPPNGISYGVSSPSTTSPEVFISMDNHTDQSQSYSRICSVSFLNLFRRTSLQDSECSAEGSNDLLNPVHCSTGNKDSLIPARGSPWEASAPAAL